MGTRYNYSVALLLAVVSFLHGSTAKLTMNDLCALFYDGFLIADQGACDTYYMCQGGIATAQVCSGGYYFDKETQNCWPQGQVQCLAVSGAPCSGTPLGSWAPVAGSCTDFYYCSLNGPERSSCPYGEYFDPAQQACVYADQYECAESMGSGSSQEEQGSSESVSVTLPLNLCSFVKNGMFFGSPSKCNGWNKCVDNALISGVCSDTLLYNVLTMECQYPAEVSCTQVTFPSNTCSTVNATKAGTTCETYLVCDGYNYQTIECPNGEFFDTVSETCVNRLEARNNCDRCVGSSNTFVNMYSTSNCTGYLYCVNGVEAASGYCPNGSYFDERLGACFVSNTDPLLGCCNPAYFTDHSGNTTEVNNDISTESVATTTSVSEVTTSVVVEATTANANATTAANATITANATTTANA